MASPPHSPNDSTEGIRADFRGLFEREFGYVWGALLRLGVHAGDAEDVAQELFFQVYRKFDEYDPQRPLRPWLFGFAFRAASDYRRLARHRAEVIGSDADVAIDRPLAEDILVQADEGAIVATALDEIDLGRRAVLVAYELEEQPMKEIAEALQIPMNTAYSRLRRARDEFAAAVKRQRLKRGRV